MAAKPSSLWVRDELVGDAMESAKAAGSDVSVQDALDFIVPILERMEHKQADGTIQRDLPKQSDQDKSQSAQVSEEFKRRAKDPDAKWSGYRRQTDLAHAMSQAKQLNPLESKMVERLRLLRSKPELRKQMEALVPALSSGNRDARSKAERKLHELLDRSNVLFGDWRATPAGKMYF